MERLAAEFRADRVHGFVPTGWTYDLKSGPFRAYAHQDRDWTIHLVPYSEHSSFQELTAYVKSVRRRLSVPRVCEPALILRIIAAAAATLQMAQTEPSCSYRRRWQAQ